MLPRALAGVFPDAELFGVGYEGFTEVRMGDADEQLRALPCGLAL